VIDSRLRPLTRLSPVPERLDEARPRLRSDWARLRLASGATRSVARRRPARGTRAPEVRRSRTQVPPAIASVKSPEYASLNRVLTSPRWRPAGMRVPGLPHTPSSVHSGDTLLAHIPSKPPLLVPNLLQRLCGGTSCRLTTCYSSCTVGVASVRREYGRLDHGRRQVGNQHSLLNPSGVTHRSVSAPSTAAPGPRTGRRPLFRDLARAVSCHRRIWRHPQPTQTDRSARCMRVYHWSGSCGRSVGGCAGFVGRQDEQLAGRAPARWHSRPAACGQASAVTGRARRLARQGKPAQRGILARMIYEQSTEGDFHPVWAAPR